MFVLSFFVNIVKMLLSIRNVLLFIVFELYIIVNVAESKLNRPRGVSIASRFSMHFLCAILTLPARTVARLFARLLTYGVQIELIYRTLERA